MNEKAKVILSTGDIRGDYEYDFSREELSGFTGKKTTAIISAYGTGIKFK